MTKTERYVRNKIDELNRDITSDWQVYSHGMLAAYECVLDKIMEEKRDHEVPT